MSAVIEKRLWQAILLVVLILPFTAAIAGVAGGPRFLGHPPVVPTDLDSHFRYVSGIFLAMLVGYVSCLRSMETKTARLRLLGALTVAGGLARLGSLLAIGVPSIGHQIGLFIELGIAPAMLLWQARIARRFGR